LLPLVVIIVVVAVVVAAAAAVHCQEHGLYATAFPFSIESLL